MVSLEAPVGVEVRRHDPQQGVAVAGSQIAFDDFRKLPDDLGEFLGLFRILGLEPDPGENRQADADPCAVQDRHIAVNDPGLLQQTHTPETGRGRKTDLRRKLIVLDPPVPLQGAEDAAVNGVQPKWQIVVHITI